MTLSIAPLQRQAVRATAAVCRPSVFFFLLLLFVQYLPPFLQRDADPFGLRRACNSTLVTSLAPSVFLHSRRGGLVYTVLGRRARRPRRSLSRGCYRCARADPQRLARSRRLLVTPALAVPILRARALTSGGDGSRSAHTKVKSRHFEFTLHLLGHGLAPRSAVSQARLGAVDSELRTRDDSRQGPRRWTRASCQRGTSPMGSLARTARCRCVSASFLHAVREAARARQRQL